MTRLGLYGGPRPDDDDTIAPTVTSAAIDSTGSFLTVNFDEPMHLGSATGDLGFDLAGATLTYQSGETSTALLFQITPKWASGGAASLDYVAPTGGLQDAENNELASFEDQSVTNASLVIYGTGDTTVTFGGTGNAIDAAILIGGNASVMFAAILVLSQVIFISGSTTSRFTTRGSIVVPNLYQRSSRHMVDNGL